MSIPTDRIRAALLLSAAGITLAWGVLGAEAARADDCLLDRDNDGVVDAGTDNDGGADSANGDTRLACGVGASALSIGGTALGYQATVASGADNAVAIGFLANAEGDSSIAMGAGSDALLNESIAIGGDSDDAGALGAQATIGAVAIGTDADASAPFSNGDRIWCHYAGRLYRNHSGRRFLDC